MGKRICVGFRGGGGCHPTACMVAFIRTRTLMKCWAKVSSGLLPLGMPPWVPEDSADGRILLMSPLMLMMNACQTTAELKVMMQDAKRGGHGTRFYLFHNHVGHRKTLHSPMK
jgi:hypothetical protein